MGIIRGLSVVAWVLAVSACTEDPAAEQRRRLLDVEEPPQKHRPQPPPPLYDEDGKLLPSEERFAGLPLPRGLKRMRDAEKRRIYTTHVPVEKLRAYFGPRLLTGQVRAEGGSITYLAAAPRDVKGGVVKLDVRIGSNPSKPSQSLVDIRERPPAREQPWTEAEIRARLERQQKYAD